MSQCGRWGVAVTAVTVLPVWSHWKVRVMGSLGDPGLYPQPPRAQAIQGWAWDCRPWVWAPFFPSLPFLLHHLVLASDCIPRPCSKVPGSNLPWGGSGERVRLVNSAGLSGVGRVLWEHRPREATQWRGHGKGPYTAAPTPAPTSPDATLDLCPHPSCSRAPVPVSHCGLIMDAVAAHCGLTMCQQPRLHLTSTSFDLHTQAKVQRGKATSSRSHS